MSFHLLSQAMHAKKAPAARSATGYGSYEKYNYRLPNVDELASSNIVMEINRDGSGRVEKSRIQPVEVLSRSIQDYLPPAGPYYDMMQFEKVFGKNLMNKSNKCMSCWKQKHVNSLRDCRQECALCRTGDHVGSGCHAPYMPMTLWELLGHMPPHGYQLRPEAAEQAYLVLAGIIHLQENKAWPIRPNMDHPLVREFYEGRDHPEPLFRKATIPARAAGTSKAQAKLITTHAETVNETETAPVLATALPTTGTASVDSSLPNIAKPHTAAVVSIEQEQEELPWAIQEVVDEEIVAENQALPPTMVEQLRGMIAERDAKVAELEKRLADQGKELEEVKAMIGMKDEDHRRWMDEKDDRISELENAADIARSALGPSKRARR
ncbi:uncharacterized protein J4E88_001968 [Alternaria novae-zelandiae]|uniref:uncharacterized protein n=1 Tax=Alternaria novae-zelandiae TaxID=430562 RepID=UPI0020C36B75|nr:uncharacterized protein J4E88_001968 [Alternaria novae-zelandiae]KAI4693595.1 hypothetical protein J4E88_001968 [Alternaria novae-zelandiae]